MSNIEENAFQIARFLLGKPDVSGHSFIRDSLSFSEQDFQHARKFLVDGGYLRSAGRAKTGRIIEKDLAKLQEFVNRINENRIPLSRDAEQLLKYLVDDQTPDFPLSLADPTMKDMGWNRAYYMQVAQELGDYEFASGDYGDGNPFFTISIEPDGRQAVRNNFRKTHLEKTESIVIKAGDNSIINFNSALNSVAQSINLSPTLSLENKQQLDAFLAQLFDALQELPPEREDDAEAVAIMAQELIENVTREKPNKPLAKISAEGLIKAAENISRITPSVLSVAQSIIVFIQANLPALPLHLN